MQTKNNNLKKSEQTKLKIIAAAKKYFTLRSYEQVGLREIAKTAGVDVALVNRYFGTKKNLYQIVIEETYGTNKNAQATTAKSSMFANADIGKLLAHHMIKIQSNEIYAARNNLFLQSITSETASEIIGPQFHDCFVKQIESAISGANAKMKAELITSLVIGSSAIFTLFKRDIVNDYDEDEFIQAVSKMINSIL